ncbi:hypothetical protein [Portibacter marinus]|uniref:hypothetical protein n=1 Tax=Portibacter marinus TaxID=2898660 RepID=UPI001F2540BC|nr:hypothetical protein [Portibacter marinus]
MKLLGNLVLILLLSFLLNQNKVSGQLNVRIGYNLDYASYNVHNQIIEQFNSERPWLNEKFKPLRFSNALQFGARIRRSFVGWDLNFERSKIERSASGNMPGSGNFSKSIDYVTYRLGTGIEFYGNVFGLGANIYFERFNISTSVDNAEITENTFRNDRLGSKIYFIATSTGTERLSISLQPYVAIPFTAYDLNPLATSLNLTNYGSARQRNLHFGVSLVFYNGPQRY